MSKFALFVFCFMFTACAAAQNPNEALYARDEALRGLKGFNPAAVLKGYTTHPKESALKPPEGSNALGALGLNALKENKEADEVYTQAGARSKVRSNPDSTEMRYAEKLLENSDSVLEGTCYKEAPHCKNESITKTCEEVVAYTKAICNERLKVTIQPIIKSLTRMIHVSTFRTTITIDLQACKPKDLNCSKANTFLLAPHCEQLDAVVTHHNSRIQIIKQPSCTDTTLTVQFPMVMGDYSVSLPIKVTEYVSEEQWQKDDCDLIGRSNSQCFLEQHENCLEPNQTKTIQGVSIQRPCWNRATTYQCTHIKKSTCTPLIHQGCSQVSSHCVQSKAKRCQRFSQTFTCMTIFCEPEKTVCPGKIGCSEGECDASASETSDDMAEGLSRLGALAGAASDVAGNQVPSGMPAIFTGKAQECKKHPLGIRDCCTGKGWGDWIKHCPQDLQILQRAKKENRVVYLGSYKKEKLGARRYSYCIFPTRLAAIFQIQGRGSQLGISYGTAKHPDCRGLTPEELERINFSALDLSPLEKELITRMALPNDTSIGSANQSHIEKLKRQGRAHD